MSDVGRRLNYGQLMQRAMRRMMADVLSDVADNGLPGEHHFYIGFETGHPGVDIPDWLHERYPEEMTIVLQEWFDDLAVTPDRFSVTLNFSNLPQTLVIPFEAVRTFVDPSVRFGLKFDPREAGEANLEDMLPEDEAGAGGEAATDGDQKGADSKSDGNAETPRKPADVVSLDRFRKQ